MLNITFTPAAYLEYLDWLETDKRIFLKLTHLIQETARTPHVGSGKPEPLKYELKGYWSRRITHEHRLVYSFDEQVLKIISCKYHY